MSLTRGMFPCGHCHICRFVERTDNFTDADGKKNIRFNNLSIAAQHRFYTYSNVPAKNCTLVRRSIRNKKAKIRTTLNGVLLPNTLIGSTILAPNVLTWRAFLLLLCPTTGGTQSSCGGKKCGFIDYIRWSPRDSVLNWVCKYSLTPGPDHTLKLKLNDNDLCEENLQWRSSPLTSRLNQMSSRFLLLCLFILNSWMNFPAGLNVLQKFDHYNFRSRMYSHFLIVSFYLLNHDTGCIIQWYLVGYNLEERSITSYHKPAIQLPPCPDEAQVT